MGQTGQNSRTGLGNLSFPKREQKKYTYQELKDAGLNEGEIDKYFREMYDNQPIDYGTGLDYSGVSASDVAGTSAGLY